jgi:hypothetical protein
MIQQSNLYLARYKVPLRGPEDIAVLTDSFKVVWKGTCIVVPKGFATDGSSVPRIARALVDRMTGIEASVVHDYLYATQKKPKDYADDLFNAMLAENINVSWMQRHAMYRAVQVFGRQAYYKVDWGWEDEETVDD